MEKIEMEDFEQFALLFVSNIIMTENAAKFKKYEPNAICPKCKESFYKVRHNHYLCPECFKLRN